MKSAIGVASLVLVFIGYAPYVRDILKNKTKPHAFSWLVWSVLSAIAFSVQITSEAGPGAWLMGATTLITLSVFLFSLKRGEKNILTVDWASLLFAGIALLLWFITDDPLLSIVLISLVDLIGGFFPTFRKSIKHPEQETATLYFVYGLSLCLSLLALERFSLVNALYPASFVAVNWGMCLFLVVRKKKLA